MWTLPLDALLLATRLRIPPQSQHTVPRTKLINTLETGIPHYRISLISAPAGYGKTTLMSQWAHASQLPIAWVTIGPEDDDVERFLRCLVMAWEAVQPDIRQTAMGLILGTTSPNVETALS